MIGTIVTGHAKFASGFVGAIKMLIGEAKIVGIDYPGGNPDDLIGIISEAIKSYKDCTQIYVLCDIMGGTPFKAAATSAQGEKNVQVLYGANLDMAMDLCMRNFDQKIAPQEIVAAETMQTGKDRIGKFD